MGSPLQCSVGSGKAAALGESGGLNYCICGICCISDMGTAAPGLPRPNTTLQRTYKNDRRLPGLVRLLPLGNLVALITASVAFVVYQTWGLLLLVYPDPTLHCRGLTRMTADYRVWLG